MTESSIFDVQDLRAWLEYPTWSIREGLLLLAGIDPHRSDCISSNESCTTFNSSIPPGTLPHDAGWNRIGYRPRGWEVGSDGVPCRVNGPVCSHEDFVALGKLMEHWHRTPAHDGMTRATPAHFIGWAESANLAPPWLDAVRYAGYLPGVPAVARPEPVAAPAEAVPDAEIETPVQKRERLQQRVNHWKAQGVRDWTARVAGEEGVTVARIRQILGKAEAKAPTGRKKAKPRPPATFCSGLMTPAGRTR